MQTLALRISVVGAASRILCATRRWTSKQGSTCSGRAHCQWQRIFAPSRSNQHLPYASTSHCNTLALGLFIYNRLDDILARLSPKEKCASLDTSNPAVVRLGLPQLQVGEGLHGVASACGSASARTGGTGCPTSFPCPTALGATFGNDMVVITVVHDDSLIALSASHSHPHPRPPSSPVIPRHPRHPRRPRHHLYLAHPIIFPTPLMPLSLSPTPHPPHPHPFLCCVSNPYPRAKWYMFPCIHS
jgi:hypothetical protein